jgi:predicted transcriptional regulator
MPLVKKRPRSSGSVEQLSAFAGLEPVELPAHEPSPDTMRQIVSLRMPDALLERVESAARSRGVSPSSLMRALIAAGLDRSYAAVTEHAGQLDLATELAAVHRRLDEIAARLEERE